MDKDALGMRLKKEIVCGVVDENLTHAEAAADDRVQVHLDAHGCGEVRIRADNAALADDVAGVMPLLGELLEEKLAELGAEDVSVEVGEAVKAAVRLDRLLRHLRGLAGGAVRLGAAAAVLGDSITRPVPHLARIICPCVVTPKSGKRNLTQESL